MNMIRTLLASILALGISFHVQAKEAPVGWRKVGTFTATGDGKELVVIGHIPVCKIRCISGAVIINTIVVREGTKATPIKVGTRIATSYEAEIPLIKGAKVTGLRIGDDGRGVYEVFIPTPVPTPAVVVVPPVVPAPAPVVKVPPGWTFVAHMNTAGKASEVVYQGRVSVLRIECLQGSTIINTVVVRHPGKNVTRTVGSRIEQGRFLDLPIEEGAPVTGFRISDAGKGSYRLLVR